MDRDGFSYGAAFAARSRDTGTLSHTCYFALLYGGWSPLFVLIVLLIVSLALYARVQLDTPCDWPLARHYVVVSFYSLRPGQFLFDA